MRYSKTLITAALVMLMLSVSGLRDVYATSATAASRMGPVLPAQGAAGERQILSLESAIALGLASDETLKQAGEGVLGAEATVREAKSGRIPTLDFITRYGRNILKPVMFLPSDMGDAFGGITRIEIGEDNEITVLVHSEVGEMPSATHLNPDYICRSSAWGLKLP